MSLGGRGGSAKKTQLREEAVKEDIETSITIFIGSKTSQTKQKTVKATAYGYTRELREREHGTENHSELGACCRD